MAMKVDMEKIHHMVNGLPGLVAGEFVNLMGPVNVQMLTHDEFIVGLENKAIALEVAVSEINSQ